MSGMHLFPNTGSSSDDVRQRGLFSKLESKFAQGIQQFNARPEPGYVGGPIIRPNPLRLRKTPVSQGAVREGLYRIVSAVRSNDSVGFLELQRDNTIRVVPLNEASYAQKWMLTYYQNSKYYIKSALDPRVLAVRQSTGDPNLSVAVGEQSFATAWTVEPRHDAYFIGVVDDNRVLDIGGGDMAVFRNLNGNPTQLWDLEPVWYQYYPAFKEGIKYLIRNHASGRVIWLCNNSFTTYGSDDGDSTLYFTFKNRPDGGTAVHSVGNNIWAAPGLKTSTTESSYRFIPAAAGSTFYFICPDMVSHPAMVIQEDLSLAELVETNQGQMWELVPKM